VQGQGHGHGVGGGHQPALSPMLFQSLGEGYGNPLSEAFSGFGENPGIGNNYSGEYGGGSMDGLAWGSLGNTLDTTVGHDDGKNKHM
jgi:hypothetical protein